MTRQCVVTAETEVTSSSPSRLAINVGTLTGSDDVSFELRPSQRFFVRPDARRCVCVIAYLLACHSLCHHGNDVYVVEVLRWCYHHHRHHHRCWACRQYCPACSSAHDASAAACASLPPCASEHPKQKSQTHGLTEAFNTRQYMIENYE